MTDLRPSPTPSTCERTLPQSMVMKRSLLFFVLVLGCQFTFAQTGDKGSESSSGSASQSASATRDSIDEFYRAALIKKARAHARLAGSDEREKTLEARFLVRHSPFGEVVSVEKIQGSGDPEYDRAIWEGIWRASPFPKKTDGTVEGEVRLNFTETPAAKASR